MRELRAAGGKFSESPVTYQVVGGERNFLSHGGLPVEMFDTLCGPK
jgi:hypothetical protein